MFKVFVWLTLLAHVSAQSFKISQFNKTLICSTPYGSVIGSYGDVRTTIGCSVLCSKIAECRSFTYNATSRTCSPNALTLASLHETCGADVLYGEMQIVASTASTTDSPPPASTNTNKTSAPVVTSRSSDVTSTSTYTPVSPTAAASSTASEPSMLISTTMTPPPKTSTMTTALSATAISMMAMTTMTSSPTTTTTKMTETVPSQTKTVSPQTVTSASMTLSSTTITTPTATNITKTTTNLTAITYCQDGTRYDPGTDMCVQDCKGLYSNTFQRVPGRWVDFSAAVNAVFLTKIFDPNVCRDHCLNETTFICKSFNLQTQLNKCQYGNATPFTDTFQVHSDYISWHRDCQ